MVAEDCFANVASPLIKITGMKTLVVYYSLTKNNELLAKELQQRLSCDILQIREQRRRNKFILLLDLLFKREPKLVSHGFEVSAYDQLIFVAPIWAGKIASPLRSFLEYERSNIKRYSFITVCGGAEGQKEKIMDELTGVVKRRPVAVTELWISKLLEARGEGVIEYRLSHGDIDPFSEQIEGFLFSNRRAHERAVATNV